MVSEVNLLLWSPPYIISTYRYIYIHTYAFHHPHPQSAKLPNHLSSFSRIEYPAHNTPHAMLSYKSQTELQCRLLSKLKEQQQYLPKPATQHCQPIAWRHHRCWQRRKARWKSWKSRSRQCRCCHYRQIQSRYLKEQPQKRRKRKKRPWLMTEAASCRKCRCSLRKRSWRLAGMVGWWTGGKRIVSCEEQAMDWQGGSCSPES